MANIYGYVCIVCGDDAHGNTSYCPPCSRLPIPRESDDDTCIRCRHAAPDGFELCGMCAIAEIACLKDEIAVAHRAINELRNNVLAARRDTANR